MLMCFVLRAGFAGVLAVNCVVLRCDAGGDDGIYDNDNSKIKLYRKNILFYFLCQK